MHNFCCVIAYLLTSLIYKEAREGFEGGMPSMLDKLTSIRLGTLIEDTGKRSVKKATYLLEEMNEAEHNLPTR